MESNLQKLVIMSSTMAFEGFLDNVVNNDSANVVKNRNEEAYNTLVDLCKKAQEDPKYKFALGAAFSAGYTLGYELGDNIAEKEHE